MKNKMNSIGVGKIGRVFGLAALFAAAAVSPAFAETNTKTFEFGAGTGQLHANVRTFFVPCGVAVTATVSFRRHGPDGANSDIPIKIDLREPDTAANDEGPIAETDTAFAKKTSQTLTLSDGKSIRGCSAPWRVRVRYAEEGTAPVTVYGNITVSFNDSTRSVSVENLSYAERKIGHPHDSFVSIAGETGFEQGRIEITANWHHNIGGTIQGPLPVQLKVELLNPDGDIVKASFAYSSNEARSDLPKLKLIYQVPNRIPGLWKIRISNGSDNDAYIDSITVKFTPDCP